LFGFCSAFVRWLFDVCPEIVRVLSGGVVLQLSGRS
jgi:hypothetical protein